MNHTNTTFVTIFLSRFLPMCGGGRDRSKLMSEWQGAKFPFLAKTVKTGEEVVVLERNWTMECQRRGEEEGGFGSQKPNLWKNSYGQGWKG